MDLTIITINYNSSLHTISMINSIVQHTNGLNFEIIVVDNASREEEYKLLKENFPQQENIKLVRSKLNLGFGMGNMFGLQYASNSNYLAFVNNDVTFKENTLNLLFDYMQQNPKVGVCGAEVIFNTDEFKLSSFGHFYDLRVKFLGTKRYEKIYNKHRIDEPHEKPITVDFILGSLMFFRAKDFASIGGFDPNLFLYYEEMDTCLRLKKMGKETHYVPFSTYIHEAGLSTRKIDKGLNLIKEQQISYNHVFKKHYGMKRYVFLYVMDLIKLFFNALLTPKIYFPLLKLQLQFNPMHKSMKYQQKIVL